MLLMMLYENDEDVLLLLLHDDRIRFIAFNCIILSPLLIVLLLHSSFLTNDHLHPLLYFVFYCSLLLFVCGQIN